jgi:hypothetical protein
MDGRVVGRQQKRLRQDDREHAVALERQHQTVFRQALFPRTGTMQRYRSSGSIRMVPSVPRTRRKRGGGCGRSQACARPAKGHRGSAPAGCSDRAGLMGRVTDIGELPQYHSMRTPVGGQIASGNGAGDEIAHHGRRLSSPEGESKPGRRRLARNLPISDARYAHLHHRRRNDRNAELCGHEIHHRRHVRYELADDRLEAGCRGACGKCTTSHLRVTVWSPVAQQTGLGAIARGGQCPSSNGHEQNVVAIINLLQTAALQCQHSNESLHSPWPRSRRISSCMRRHHRHTA